MIQEARGPGARRECWHMCIIYIYVHICVIFGCIDDQASSSHCDEREKPYPPSRGGAGKRLRTELMSNGGSILRHSKHVGVLADSVEKLHGQTIYMQSTC